MCTTNNNDYIIWKSVNAINKKNIIWKQSSWFCKRGYHNNENIYLVYIWGTKYIKVNNVLNSEIKNVSCIDFLRFKTLLTFGKIVKYILSIILFK
jgi:hypothetical protein